MIIDHKYKIDDKILGRGNFGQVHLGKCLESDELVAIKCISVERTRDSSISIENEINIMKNLNHPNIVRYIDFIKTDTHWYVIMEYCNMGSFTDVIKYNEAMNDNNREANTYYYLLQLKNALEYLRSVGCSHRDIKPDNIMLSNPGASFSLADSDNIFKYDEQLDSSNYDYRQEILVKLGDFGLSKINLNGDMMKTICGSPLYMAPEIFKNRGYASKSDIWSFGIVMYQLLFGRHPLESKTFPELKARLDKTSQVTILNRGNLTPPCVDLLEKILVTSSVNRLEWTDFLNHTWFTYWTEIINTGNFTVDNRDVPLRGSTGSTGSTSRSFGNQIGSKSGSRDNLGPSGLSKMRFSSIYFGSGSASSFPQTKPKLSTDKNSLPSQIIDDYISAPINIKSSTPNTSNTFSSFSSFSTFSSFKSRKN